MPKFTQIIAREILDSRGHPTVETTVVLDSGHWAVASVPSGASTGSHEDVELRDNDPNRLQGLGILKAVNNVNTIIAPKLLGMNVEDQEGIDNTMLELDHTKNESRLGANAILSVSIAALKAAAASEGKPLFAYIHDRYSKDTYLTIPAPTFNLINGGKHGAGNLDFQEFHIIPSTRFTYPQALIIAVEINLALKKELIHRGAIHSVGDEGGFAPNLFTNTDALELLALVIKNSPYNLQQDVFLGLDVAADSFYQNGKYLIKDVPRPLDAEGLAALYASLIKEYNLFSIEDPFHEGDWKAWAKFQKSLPPHLLLVGDDLLTTNAERLRTAIKEKACNTILVKPNQSGTITETIQVIQLARENSINTIVSHRSGETNDTFIADFAVGMAAGFTKFGAPVRGERVAKYNRLLEIESYLKRK